MRSNATWHSTRLWQPRSSEIRRFCLFLAGTNKLSADIFEVLACVTNSYPPTPTLQLHKVDHTFMQYTVYCKQAGRLDSRWQAGSFF